MKDNANPTVYDTTSSKDRRDERYYNQLIASKALSRFGFDPKNVNTLDVPSIPTSIERSVHMTIHEIDKDTKKDSKQSDPLALLKVAGMFSKNNRSSLLNGENNHNMEFPSIFQQCHFLPQYCGSNSNSDSITKPSQKRDPIESEEVFDIIRNIQDPEHPLTLEQLNVVNLEHVAVRDVLTDGDDTDDFSTIDVRFT
jgi:hypothetical protein